MKKLLVLPAVAVAMALMALVAEADAPPGPFFQGFEVNDSLWLDTSDTFDGTITRQPSGYTNAGGYADGIASATGGFHARLSGEPPACSPPADCFGPFTRWGGYTRLFPIGGYRTQVSVYLDVAWAATNPDRRFDISSSINDTSGSFLQDYVFNAGTQPSGSPGFDVNASTNATRSSAFPQNPCPAPSGPPNACRTPVHITTSGWYTFRHTFRDNAGMLAVDFEIFDSTSTLVPGASWTIHPGHAMAGVGGNRYGWFVIEEIADLPIDDSQRTGLTLALAPPTATNALGTNHTVTATVSSTDAGGRPSPGPGVTVEFDVIAGPNIGQTSHPVNSGTCATNANCTTDAAGQVSWTYTSNGTPGTDTIQACFPERNAGDFRAVGDDVRAQCQTVSKTWAAATDTPTNTPTNTSTNTPTNTPVPPTSTFTATPTSQGPGTPTAAPATNTPFVPPAVGGIGRPPEILGSADETAVESSSSSQQRTAALILMAGIATVLTSGLALAVYRRRVLS